MRDPMTWAVPLYTLFGIRVRLHILFPVIAVGLVLRQLALRENTVWAGGVVLKENPVYWGEVFGLAVLLLFAVVLLHEYGHCLAGKLVGGDPKDILLWPLGGLATVNTPPVPRALILTVLGGPLVNLVLCLSLAAVLAGVKFVPNLNPLANPYVAELKNLQDGRVYTSQYGANLYKPGVSDTKEKLTPAMVEKFGKPDEFREEVAKAELQWAVAPPWVVWVQRAFWLNWLLLLLNLLPAYPLDGGQLLQGVIWARSDARQGTVTACYSGFVVCLLLLVFGVAANDAMVIVLAGFVYLMSAAKLAGLDADEAGPMGYDFSQGYTSLERDDAPPPPKPRQGFLARWRQARTAKRMAREAEERQRDEARMDELLDKIARKVPLTDEEKRFLQRVSERYRNRS